VCLPPFAIFCLFDFFSGRLEASPFRPNLSFFFLRVRDQHRFASVPSPPLGVFAPPDLRFYSGNRLRYSTHASPLFPSKRFSPFSPCCLRTCLPKSQFFPLPGAGSLILIRRSRLNSRRGSTGVSWNLFSEVFSFLWEFLTWLFPR